MGSSSTRTTLPQHPSPPDPGSDEGSWSGEAEDIGTAGWKHEGFPAAMEEGTDPYLHHSLTGMLNGAILLPSPPAAGWCCPVKEPL